MGHHGIVAVAAAVASSAEKDRVYRLAAPTVQGWGRRHTRDPDCAGSMPVAAAAAAIVVVARGVAGCNVSGLPAPRSELAARGRGLEEGLVAGQEPCRQARSFGRLTDCRIAALAY